MSTAEAEKATPKPAAPLGSFLTKLTPKAEEKSAEAKHETDKTVGREPERTVKADDKVDAPTSQEKAQDAGTVEAKQPTELKPEEKPKEDVTEKRLKDTQKWGNEEHKARLDAERRAAEFEAQLKRIEAKLDGTYQEPADPSPQQIADDADVRGRIKASHSAAVRQYGKTFVMETVWDRDSPYQALQANSPRIRARVMESDDPVLEAIAVVKEHQDGEKYGRTPEEIRKKMEEELRPKLKNEILEGLKTKPGPATATLGNVRGGTERTEQKNDAPTRLNFRDVFPWGASRT